jgi:hypothetical protein
MSSLSLSVHAIETVMDNESIFIQNVTRDMVLQEKTGKQCSAVEVFTLSIKAFVDDLMKHLEGIYFMQHEVLWVFTVSIAWTDSDKELMRESAEKGRFSLQHHITCDILNKNRFIVHFKYHFHFISLTDC